MWRRPIAGGFNSASINNPLITHSVACCLSYHFLTLRNFLASAHKTPAGTRLNFCGKRPYGPRQMASLTSGAYPPTLKDEEHDNLVETIKDWSIANGLAIRPPPTVISAEADPNGIAAVNAPVTLFPSPFPRRCFDQGKAVQKAYNELYAAVSRDEEFLAQIVKELDTVSSFPMWANCVQSD